MDKEITCIDCGTVFQFTAIEAIKYKAMDFAEPRRCKPCRLKKKKQKIIYLEDEERSFTYRQPYERSRFR